jgi:hypothetical protein
MKRGRFGRRRSIWEGGVQDGHSRFIATLLVPLHSKPGRPTPDAIFDRLIPRKDVIKTAFLRRNDNRAGRITAIVGDEFARRGDGARTAFHANQGRAKNLLVFISAQGRAGRGEQKRCRVGDGQKVTVHSVFTALRKDLRQTNQRGMLFSVDVPGAGGSLQ